MGRDGKCRGVLVTVPKIGSLNSSLRKAGITRSQVLRLVRKCPGAFTIEVYNSSGILKRNFGERFYQLCKNISVNFVDMGCVGVEVWEKVL